MGVPGFFAWLLKNFKHTILQKKLGNKIDYLYIDANCLFHPECNKIKEYCSSCSIEILEKKMFQRIVNYLDFLEKFANPQKAMIISVDGVAPLAKMGQQRKRRYKTIVDTNIRNEIKQKYKKEINDKWNNTVITPGTEFMERLNIFLKKHYKSKKSDIKYIYSSYHTAGEGEHKILQHIKNTANIKDNIIIYGLDADLIFLAMSSGYENIYLLREALHFGPSYKKDKEVLSDPVKDVEQELIYVSIKETKKAFNSEIWTILNNRRDIKFNLDKSIDFTNDLVVICFLLGNDFLPHFPSLDIYKGGLDIIIDAYIECVILLRRTLTNTHKHFKIDTIFLLKMLETIGLKEESFFQDILPTYTERTRRKRCFAESDYDKEIWDLDNMRLYNVADPIKLGMGEIDEWKFRYYEYFFQISECQDEYIEEIVYVYLQGIMWVSNYYFDKCRDWKWFYPFDHAPFISDIVNYLMKYDIDLNDIKFKRVNPVTPMIQLTTILPPACLNLLPINYRKYVISDESDIVDLFPIETELDMLYKDQYWQCNPILPILDIDRIVNTLFSIELTEDEKKRNVIENDYEF